MKKILKNIAFMFLILLITGCGENSKLSNGEDVLISFENDKLNISVNELYEKLKEEHGADYMIEMIDEKILNLKYETDDIANAYVENQYEAVETSYGGADKFLEALQNYGYESPDEFKEELLLSYKRELALKDHVKANVSDSDIEKYYKNEIFGDITASHILITVESNSTMTDEEKREAENKATETINEIYKKLEEGSNFHDLAKEYSEDTSNASNGGRLGTFSKGEMESTFENAAVNLEVGKYNTTAVKTSYGYHIIYKEAQKDKPALETIKQVIIDNIVDERIKNDTKLQYEALIELRKSYGIKINDETLNDQYENAVNNWLYGE